jgi:hypothetical protein
VDYLTVREYERLYQSAETLPQVKEYKDLHRGERDSPKIRQYGKPPHRSVSTKRSLEVRVTIVSLYTFSLGQKVQRFCPAFLDNFGQDRTEDARTHIEEIWAKCRLHRMLPSTNRFLGDGKVVARD